ncbi:MAG: Thiamin-phosphate pyrophosphorylase, partial [Labilithrix sp.]|nr:Thiamin-phosphate pyrophosphorylase [Labilithrix sp.]
ADALTPGRVALAGELAEGAHVPQPAGLHDARAALGAAAWLTTAAHDEDDVAGALRGGADAVLVSPIFATPGKGVPRGVQALTAACALASGAVEVVALGGVDVDQAAMCAAAGAHGVAVIRALHDAASPRETAAGLAGPFLAARVAGRPVGC